MRSTKVAAGICTYAEPQGLRRTLASLQVDRIFVIHGPYPHFGLHDLLSLSDTKAVCEQYSNVRLIDIPQPTHENIRREKYLGLMKNYDFCLTIDSDEYISDGADWGFFYENLKKVLDVNPPFYLYDIMFDGYPAQSGPKPRLFYQPSKIKYYKKHYWWTLPNGKIAAGSSDSKCVIEGIRITHDKEHRSAERHEAMYAHQRWLLEYDSQFVLTSKDPMV